MSGWPWSAIKGLALAPTESLSEQAMLLAAVGFADKDGCLHPSIKTWAGVARCNIRTAQRALESLVKNGIVEVVSRTSGGRGNTTIYRIPLLAENPGVVPGLCDVKPRHGGRETPASGPHNPGTTTPKPRHGAGGTTMKSQMNNHEQPAVAVDDVFARFRIEHLRNHPNATPERLAYIEAAAPTKDYPDRFAAACIRDGYDVPPKFQAVAKKERDRVEREASIERFNRMTPNEQRDVLNRAWALHPNLHGKPADAPGMAGAIHQVLQSSASIAAEIEPKGTTTPARSAQERR